MFAMVVSIAFEFVFGKYFSDGNVSECSTIIIMLLSLIQLGCLALFIKINILFTHGAKK
jgi:hypothetical protein